MPGLLKQVSAKEAMVEVASVWAVRRIDPANRQLAPVAVPILVKLLGASDEIVRFQAAGALGDLGPAAQRRCRR